MRHLFKVKTPPSNLKYTSAPSINEVIMKHISGMISSGELKAGDRLLPERRMAEMLGVSRTAVRETLAKLVSLGVIEITPKKGAYIRELDLGSLIGPLAFMLIREESSLVNLMEVRLILETRISKLAAERATKSDIARLEFDAQQVIEDIEKDNDARESDTRFHMTLAKAAHNDLIFNIMSLLSGLMREPYGPARASMLKGRYSKLLGEQHVKIARAVAARKGTEADRLTAEHLKLARKEMLRFLKGNEELPD